VTVLLRAGLDDQDVAARLGRRGIATIPLSNSYVGPIRKQGLMLGFGCAVPQRLLAATRILADVLGERA
jgi:DNA-binding transcriptional MocR family regulator